MSQQSILLSDAESPEAHEQEAHHAFHRVARLPVLPQADQRAALPPVPGCTDWMTRISDDQFLMRGWMLHPKYEFSSIQVQVNGRHVGVARPTFRQDLADNIAWISHAGRGGFEIQLDPATFATNGISHIDLTGYRQPTRLEKLLRKVSSADPFGIPVGRYHPRCRADIDTATPSPPPHLMDRVVGHHDLTGFKTGGMKLYGDFLDAMAPHRDFRTVRRMLDWGCGSGRATGHFLLHPDGPEVHGCDIDAEAIAWCSANLQTGHFAAINPLPPLPYPDGYFDAIVSCSVFSHLKRDTQRLWLAELGRVLAPGGVVLASFHGTHAASVSFPPRKVARLRLAGIIDDTPDSALGNVIEEGYYMSTFQTRAYTLREWSKHLEILEYIEAGMHNYQDLAVMRKPAGK